MSTQSGRSILEHIQANLPDGAKAGLTTAGYRLPDEEPLPEGALRWAPGALEGVLGHHTVPGPQQEPAADGAEPGLSLVRAARDGQGFIQLYRWAAASADTDAVSDILDALAQEHATAADGPGIAERDRATARALAYEGSHRRAVVLGIALLALGHSAEDREKLLMLARHDELTNPVKASLAIATGDDEASLFAVAQVATGWGRVGAVNRLARTTDPGIQRWLVCGGYRAAPFGYTEMTAAQADLLGQLQRLEGRDQELVDSAVQLMRDLLSCREWGPSDHIGDYPEAADVLDLLFVLTAEHEPRLAHQALAAEARAWLSDGQDDGRDEVVIPQLRRAELIAAAERVLVRTDWLDLAIRTLADPDHSELMLAQTLAAEAGHDTFPALLHALDHGRGSLSWEWGRAAKAAGAARIGEVVERAERRLILPEINVYGSAVDYRCVGVIDGLPAEAPGVGWPLVERALAWGSRDKWPAYRALERWGRAGWPPGVEPVLRDRLARITDDRERAFVEALLGLPPAAEQQPRSGRFARLRRLRKGRQGS